jgi:hypothetical protein
MLERMPGVDEAAAGMVDDDQVCSLTLGQAARLAAFQ